MKPRKPKSPAVPAERHDTIRHEIAALIAEGPLTAKGISLDIRIAERDVYGHLEHIQRSLAHHGERRFVVVPAECKKCGFVFAKRDRLTKPGRCPVCKGESIEEPLYSIEPK